MATLTAATRNKIPTKDFAGPDRSYPVQDAGHAVAAKGRAKTALERGRISSSAYSRIVSKANKKLGRTEKQDDAA